MRPTIIVLTLLALTLVSCGKESPLQPTSKATLGSTSVLAAPTVNASPSTGRTAPGKPGYEPAYVGGQTVTINAIEVPNRAPGQALADFYEVVYPIGFHELGLPDPQCNPCDHDGNGIDPADFHDHILDSMPSAPGHGEFSPLWHVFVVVPAYNGNAAHDAALSAAYATHLPTKSEAAVDELLAAKLDDGSPLAAEIDTQFYFLCAVVGAHATN